MCFTTMYFPLWEYLRKNAKSKFFLKYYSEVSSSFKFHHNILYTYNHSVIFSIYFISYPDYNSSGRRRRSVSLTLTYIYVCVFGGSIIEIHICGKGRKIAKAGKSEKQDLSRLEGGLASFINIGKIKYCSRKDICRRMPKWNWKIKPRGLPYLDWEWVLSDLDGSVRGFLICTRCNAEDVGMN